MKKILGTLGAATGLVIAGMTAFAPSAGASTHGCAGNGVDGGLNCFYITGSGLHVDHVEAHDTYSDAPHCLTLHITVNKKPNGYNFFPFNQQTCAPAHHVFESGNINFNESFPNNTKMCARWDYNVEAKCFTIHT